jgi:hypothetical protein
MRLPIVAFSLAVLLSSSLAGCAGDSEAESDAGSTPRATWYHDVAPILAEHCMGCHHSGGIAPMSLTELEQAREFSPMMMLAVEGGIMPPWDAVDADDCTPRFGWKNDPRLSAEQIETLAIWVEDGMAAGEVEDIPEPPVTALEGITHTVTPTDGYRTSGDTDEFICFVLDPELEQPGWLNGLQLRAGNPKVVHHTVTWAVPPGATKDGLLASYGIGNAYECDGGASALPGAQLIHVWTPGNEPLETPRDVGIPLAAGSVLITQFHYHPGGHANDIDRSSLDLRITDERPDMLYTIGAWGNAFQEPELLPGPDDPGGQPVFYIPADVADHRESMRFEVALDTAARFPLLAAYPHMHYIGVGLKVKITRATPMPGEPSQECLVNVDYWDFNWQRSYQYDAAIDDLPTVGNGDVVEITCTYDNTLDNPFVERALEEQGLTDPIDVVLGEQSLDEMCLGIFPILFDAPLSVAGDGATPQPPPFRLVPIPQVIYDARR